MAEALAGRNANWE
jgi:hypothetical protein